MKDWMFRYEESFFEDGPLMETEELHTDIFNRINADSTLPTLEDEDDIYELIADHNEAALQHYCDAINTTTIDTTPALEL